MRPTVRPSTIGTVLPHHGSTPLQPGQTDAAAVLDPPTQLGGKSTRCMQITSPSSPSLPDTCSRNAGEHTCPSCGSDLGGFQSDMAGGIPLLSSRDGLVISFPALTSSRLHGDEESSVIKAPKGVLNGEPRPFEALIAMTRSRASLAAVKPWRENAAACGLLPLNAWARRTHRASLSSVGTTIVLRRVVSNTEACLLAACTFCREGKPPRAGGFYVTVVLRYRSEFFPQYRLTSCHLRNTWLL
ncbi:hypothetical protein Bbelb_059500 [Branchiostoma belcheri]|nr:hypothetical protein Bbelb_059500 [Branchiostoma belcheri]